MLISTWKSEKSLVMQEIRVRLKKKAEKGQPTLSKKEANKSWREDILGILSEDQKKTLKAKKQERNNRSKVKQTIDSE